MKKGKAKGNTEVQERKKAQSKQGFFLVYASSTDYLKQAKASVFDYDFMYTVDGGELTVCQRRLSSCNMKFQ